MGAGVNIPSTEDRRDLSGPAVPQATPRKSRDAGSLRLPEFVQCKKAFRYAGAHLLNFSSKALVEKIFAASGRDFFLARTMS